MSATYVDTSALGAYYCPEPLSQKAQAAIRKIHRPVISALTEVEFYSLISKKKRIGDFDETKARRILMEFQSHVAEGYYQKIVPLSEHYLRARDMIGEFRVALGSLDAIHLAVIANDDLPLVTADEAMARAAKRFGIKTTLLS